MWRYFNLVTRWVPETNRTQILIFDKTMPDLSWLLPAMMAASKTDSVRDPFWIYPLILEEVINLQDSAIWGIRELVRSLEKNRQSAVAPNPDYPMLHDIARHAIHVSETMDVGVKIISEMLSQHDNYFEALSILDPIQKRIKTRHHRQIQFVLTTWQGLRCRALATKERLANEIQLAFNIVAQYDSRVSVAIGRATQYDSYAMKTIAFLTLAFLPATFISALFSMSFFNYDRDFGWEMSDRFWIYWVVVVPVTAATIGFWHFWPRIFPPDEICHVQLPPRGTELKKTARMLRAQETGVESWKHNMGGLKEHHVC